MNKQTIVELIAMVVGISVVFFRKWLAKESVSFQNKKLGFKFGDKELRSAEISTATIGVAIIILALISMTRLTDFKI